MIINYLHTKINIKSHLNIWFIEYLTVLQSLFIVEMAYLTSWRIRNGKISILTSEFSSTNCIKYQNFDWLYSLRRMPGMLYCISVYCISIRASSSAERLLMHLLVLIDKAEPRQKACLSTCPPIWVLSFYSCLFEVKLFQSCQAGPPPLHFISAPWLTGVNLVVAAMFFWREIL